MAAEKPALIHVEIFGQSYAVRAGADPAYLQDIAAFVDAQMREVSRSAGAVDSVRIAVLAALNIADETFRLRAQVRDMEALAEARAGALARELQAALGE
jgi:cell division protein ZapA